MPTYFLKCHQHKTNTGNITDPTLNLAFIEYSDYSGFYNIDKYTGWNEKFELNSNMGLFSANGTC